MIQGSKTVLRRNIVNRAIVKDDKGSWVLNLQDPYFEQVQSNWRSQRDRTREQTMPYLLAEGHWKGKLPQAIAAGQAWENQDGSVSWLEVERVADKGSSKGNNFRGSITGMDDASKNKIQGMMDKMNRPAITSGGDGDDNIGLTIYGEGGAKGGWGKDGGKDTGKGGWYGGKDGGWGSDFGWGNKGGWGSGAYDGGWSSWGAGPSNGKADGGAGKGNGRLALTDLDENEKPTASKHNQDAMSQAELTNSGINIHATYLYSYMFVRKNLVSVLCTLYIDTIHVHTTIWYIIVRTHGKHRSSYI